MPILTCPSPAVTDPLLGSGNYTLSFLKFPEITFFVTQTELPAIDLGVAIQSSSVHEIPIPGETMDYDDLTCTFVVDAKMENYMAIHNWIMGMGYPSGHELYRKLMANEKNKTSPTELAKGYSDGVLTIMGNNNRAIVQARFVDCFPVNLSGLRFDSGQQDSTPLTATVNFKYTYYTLATNA